MELGIMPIVHAGGLMQLLVGSKIIGLDITNSKDRAIFRGVQKLLAILMGVFLGSVFVLAGYYDVGLGSSAGIFIIIQLTLATLILVYLCELVSKYGFGSGIGLFVVGDIATTIVWQAANPMAPYGAIPHFAGTLLGGGGMANAFFRSGALPNMMGVVATILVFLIVVYVEKIRIEIPIVHKRAGGLRGLYQIKFLYTSVIPIILTMTVFTSIITLGIFFPPLQGISYYLTPPIGIPAVLADPLQAAIYFVVLVFLCMGFSWLWVKATGMESRDLSEQFKRLGISPLNAEATNQVLDRQIIIFALLGGALVGGLVGLADFTGTLVSGYGIILAVGILYVLYGEVVREHAWDIEAWRGKKTKFEGKVCPVCGSGSFVHSGTFSGWTLPGVHTAQKYLCKNCGYTGPIIIELQSEGDVEKLKQNYSREIKDGTKYSQPIFPSKWISFWKIITVLVFMEIVVLPILILLV